VVSTEQLRKGDVKCGARDDSKQAEQWHDMRDVTRQTETIDRWPVGQPSRLRSGAPDACNNTRLTGWWSKSVGNRVPRGAGRSSLYEPYWRLRHGTYRSDGKQERLIRGIDTGDKSLVAT